VSGSDVSSVRRPTPDRASRRGCAVARWATPAAGAQIVHRSSRRWGHGGRRPSV